MVHFLLDNQIVGRIVKAVVINPTRIDEASKLVDTSKVVDLDKTDFVRTKQCLTRKINRLIKLYRDKYFELGKSSLWEPIYNYEDIVKLCVLAASRDAHKIEQLYNYYVEKYVPRLKNLNKFMQAGDSQGNKDGYYYLYLVFLHDIKNL